MTVDAFDRAAAHLEALTRRPPPEGALAAGIARIAPDGSLRAMLTGRDGPGGPPVSDPGLRLRVASVTKLALARTALAAGLDPGTPLAELLPWPDPALRLGHLLSHRSGITDGAGYVAPPPADAVALAQDSAARSGHPPGGAFRYANLNYVLIGIALERATGRRLDHLVAEHVLRPAGIGGGLNWAGVAERDRRLALWQWEGGRHVRQVDGPEGDWNADLIWRDGEGLDLAGWRPGWAPWFSPQGGLRASVPELARLARFALSDAPGARMARPVAGFGDTPGLEAAGLFREVGLGVTIYRDHPEIGGDLAGHAGQALGASTGAWLDRATGAAWGYAILGWPDFSDGLEEEPFYPPAELEIMRIIARG
ncbi:serine hydrolase domain-containing protein [Jannaschia formosa]|uniref:serine hydrolase domain-containing protein n=1 Tax=Jannaschia formosa TaxID=2259592 RepID=UPI000E1BD455|nr:serine hydrolase domain-containing protein [Jannaschia formosa]TFL19384.1 class A beta-lactamase-related serine hydrolase [Jannaschia formosa]